ncbi:MAG: CHASE2 domain-containing protein [Acidiferrobacterales bacterium]|jgi:adenylate cyclase
MRKPSTAQIQFLLAGALWLLCLLTTFGVDLLPRLENQFLDWNLRGLAARHPPDPDIVIISIDEPSLERMADPREGDWGRYPWSRAVYITLLEGLAKQEPAAIVFDIIFSDPHKGYEEDDFAFIETVQKLENVYFPMVRLPATPAVDQEQGYRLKLIKNAIPPPGGADADARAALLLPLPGLRDTGRLGTINAEPNRIDGVIRTYPVYVDAYGWKLPSLPTRVAQDLGFEIPQHTDSLFLGWHGPALSYRFVSFYDLFADLDSQSPKRPADEFKGKIAVIGATAPSLYDMKVTPMGAIFPGTEIIATALDNLKNGESIKISPAWVAPIITGLVLFALAFAVARGMPLVPAGIGWLTLSVVTVIAAWVSTLTLWRPLPVVSPLIFGWLYYLAVAIRAYWRERDQRLRVTQIFNRFLDPRVVAGLVDQGETTSSLSGQKREVTILFSDIRGFTTLSEEQPPQAIVDLLNRYFASQVEVIYQHQGTLDKYMGDGIMAFWGAPTDQPKHALGAVMAARDMVVALEAFRKELGEAGEDFDIGIGIHTGEVVVGFIGSPEHRQDYTVIGDTVNTASRIEGQTRGLCRVLVSAATRKACGSELEFRDRGSAKLKGRTKEVRLYEPLWS